MSHHSVFSELLYKYKANPQVAKKIKMFIGVTLVGFILVCALVIWGGVTVVRQVANFGGNPNVQEKVVTLGTEIKKLPAMAKVGCWDKAQSLLNIKVWIEKPLADNFKEFKQACLL